MTEESRKKLVSLFKSGYQKTGLGKLPQVIEMIDLLLENGISFIVGCYHDVFINALTAALEKRKVPFIDLSSFFVKCKDASKNQSEIIEELGQFSKIYNDEGIKNSEHLIVGVLNYSTFSANFKFIKQT